MKNKEEIKELLDYLQTTENNELQFDEEAIAVAYEKNESNQSMSITVLSVLGGLLASLAFIGFIFSAGIYDSVFGLMLFGVLFIVGAIWINKEYDKIITDTLSISFFIIGFVLLAYGLSELEASMNAICLIFILIAFLSLTITQNYLLSFISVLIINGSILDIIIFNKGYDFAHLYVCVLALMMTYVFLNEAKVITKLKAISKTQNFAKLYNPVKIGLVFSFMIGILFFNETTRTPLAPNYIWLSSIAIIGTIIYLLSYLFELLNITQTQQKTIIYISTLLVLLPTALSPAISGALLVILLSFFINHKTGFVIGVMAFIYFISNYYYDLSFTLLTKSILLFVSGVLFLGIYLLTYKKLLSKPLPNEEI